MTINGELIKTTFEHPFYVKDHGFVKAGKLYVGDKLLDSTGNILVVEDTTREITETPVKVYNFQVEDFHTYHVGENGVLVHNADYNISRSKHPEAAKHAEDAIKNGQPDTVTIDRPGAAARRRASLKGIDKVPGKQLDEFPPAMFAEGGTGSSVRPISPFDNTGSGASMGNQLRKYPNGTKIKVNIVE